MKRYALIGKNIQDSLSPELHNDWMVKFGIDGRYELFDIGAFILPNIGYSGFNVTAPYKNSFLGDKAINTIKCDPIYEAHNTDGEGFLKAAQVYGYDFADKAILVIGEGATGTEVKRALIYVGYSAYSQPGRTPPEILAHCMDDADIVINATNVEGGFCYDAIDINYKRKGKDCFGYEMLKQQAALSFEMWHGFNPLNCQKPTSEVL